ncbi:NAD-dependent protein deacetylase of SIR2 family protein [Minicystis rosea]|nr:NAD-dependent protein deacetylase of SIR2 family protein [Minicystis rosea]
MSSQDLIRRAAEAVRTADALVIGAGAGMGVDSGLPDFRGTQGFWRAYPLYAKLGLDFPSMANPRWFATDPAFAWGFYGHRLELYRRTVPHEGFAILRRWAEGMKHGTFVFTSNVDGQFQKAGFSDDRIVEIHGSIHFVQCAGGCSGIATAEPYHFELDQETLRAKGDLPKCARCADLLRPNILMFGDGWWDGARTDAQEARMMQWLQGLGNARVVVIECGAGTAIPSVRMFCERLARGRGTLVRLNVREPEVPEGGIGLPMGALEALTAIDRALQTP